MRQEKRKANSNGDKTPTMPQLRDSMTPSPHNFLLVRTSTTLINLSYNTSPKLRQRSTNDARKAWSCRRFDELPREVASHWATDLKFFLVQVQPCNFSECDQSGQVIAWTTLCVLYLKKDDVCEYKFKATLEAE
ncbi:hypothetical protein RRG08_062775 [Elysia crispata]|uniref:Uncharacterized protein n=1 Tax=Elysia crispata TaxID=231223 RepID=A0AAE0Y4S7_9GAST|nr:hypothetical protein RRG08_062775 [Elysia crispata]